MKKNFTKFIFAVFLFWSGFSGAASAQNIFVWDGNRNNHSGPVWKTFLENNGYNVTYPPVNSALPMDYSMYDAIFLHFGFWEPGYHGLTIDEAMNIYNYALQGGRIYIEGGDIWGWPSTNPGYLIARQLCGLSNADDGSNITVNTTTPMSGTAGTITDNMSFTEYNGINSYLDYLQPDSSTGIFYNNFNCHGISWNTGTYRIVALSFEIAGLADGAGASNKDTLMSRIRDFLIPPTYVPLSVTAKPGVGQITLTWSTPQLTSGFQRYRIYFGTSPNPVSQMDSTQTGNLYDTTRTYTGLQVGTRYYFRLKTVHDGGVSGFSKEVSAKPFAAPRGIIVTTTEDTGRGSLRWAIDSANTTTAPDTIMFDPAVWKGTIYLTTLGLPPLTQPTFINGDIDDDQTPDIELDGSALTMQDIITIQSSHNVIKGLVLSGSRQTSGAGIKMTDTSSHDNLIIGNYIGIRQDGITFNPNLHGIYIQNGAYRNYIGDGTEEGRNVIAGNQYANLYLYSTHDNIIRGNYFGLSSMGAGITTVTNDNGCVYLYYSDHNQIGGPAPGDRNIISGSRSHGIYLFQSSRNSIINNWIGFDGYGGPHGNRNGGVIIDELSSNSLIAFNKIGNSSYEGSSFGIRIYNADSAAIYGNYIGTTTDGASSAGNDGGIAIFNSQYIRIGAPGDANRNIISGNFGPGIQMSNNTYVTIENNYIGTDVSGTAAIENSSHGINILDDCRMIAIGNGSESGRNVISGNSQNGIYFTNSDMPVRSINVLDNYIGTDYTGLQMLPNGFFGILASSDGAPLRVDSIAFNRIAYNGNDGVGLDGGSVDSVVLYHNSIYLNSGDGITLTAGAQNFIVPPTIQAMSGDTIYGSASEQSQIQVYADAENEGRNFLGVATTDMSGQWAFRLPAGLPPNTYITSLQTQANIRTSAFSNAYLLNPNHLIVTKAADDTSIGTLRHALQYANAQPGPDTIKFDLPAGIPIGLTYTLPALTDSYTVIEGDTDADDIPDIVINGAEMGNGLEILSSHNQVNGLIINGCGTYMSSAAILISGAGAYQNAITNCYLGTNAAGTVAVPNGNGIIIRGGAHDNRIGSAFGDGNVISGNLYSGILIQDTASVNNIIVGNRIGTDYTGNDTLSNNTGIDLYYTSYNHIGTGTTGGRNIISGNSNYGINLSYSEHNSIAGNIIGLNAAGQNALGNGWEGFYAGINLTYSKFNKIVGNVVSGNGARGGLVLGLSDYNQITGNLIGLDITGTYGIPNAGPGIAIQSGGIGNIIGNGSAEGRNVISGNTVGIEFSTQLVILNQSSPKVVKSRDDLAPKRGPFNTIRDNAICGNYIGTDYTGTNMISGTTTGISLVNLEGVIAQNTIGGADPDSGNVIGGAEYGIYISNADSNDIYQNWIGTNPAGAGSLGNDYGISLRQGASSNRIFFNHIAHNTYYGIEAQDTNTVDNLFRYNQIHNNEQGIYFINTTQRGVEPPVITGIQSDSTLYGTSVPFAFIHLYADSTSMNPQGRLFAAETTADGNGLWSMKVPVITGWTIQALQDVNNNTSEFSAPFLPKMGHLSAAPAVLNFGNVVIHTTASRVIELYSPDGVVQINGYTLQSGDRYTVDSLSGRWLLFPGDTLRIFISYHPVALNLDLDTLILLGSMGSDFRVPIRGNAVPPSGNLNVSASSVDFGSLLTGDSLALPLRLQANDGDVILSNITFSGGSYFYLKTAMTYPDTIFSGDSITIQVVFKPGESGMLRDTMHILNNSPVPEKLVSLQGIGISNSPPNAFNVKAFNAADLINNRTPTFRWEGRGDPDGDALTYRLHIAHNSTFTDTVQLHVTTDTSFTPAAPLDSLRAYYWRVRATESRGGERLSNAGFVRIDAVKPQLTPGSLFSDVLKQYVALYTATDERLADIQAGISVRNSVTSALLDTLDSAMSLVPGQDDLYYLLYKLENPGQLLVRVSGADSAGNTSDAVKTYTVAQLFRNAELVVSGDQWLIRGGKALSQKDGWVMVSRIREPKPNGETRLQAILKRQSAVPTGQPENWTVIGEGLDIKGSVPLQKNLTVQLLYDETALLHARMRYQDFDERKIGFYREDNGKWIYAGGEGHDGGVETTLDNWGKLMLFYNPDHVFLPKQIELAQNYPNPFNPATTIRFGLPENGLVRLSVYNILGQKVKELVNGRKVAGYHEILWDGRNENGMAVSSGVYIYRLETATGVKARKMLLVK